MVLVFITYSVCSLALGPVVRQFIMTGTGVSGRLLTPRWQMNKDEEEEHIASYLRSLIKPPLKVSFSPWHWGLQEIPRIEPIMLTPNSRLLEY